MSNTATFYTVLGADGAKYFESRVGLEAWMEHRGHKEYIYTEHAAKPSDIVLILSEDKIPSRFLAETLVKAHTVKKD